MFQKIGSLVIFLVLSLLPCRAQVVFHSLEEVWKYADSHNITIRTVRYELNKSAYATKQAYSALLPQVNATGSYTDNVQLQTTLVPGSLAGGPAGSFKTLQFGSQFVYTGGIAAQMNVVNLQNWYNARMAQQTQAMNKDSLASTRKIIYQQLATQYYSYLLMMEATRIADQTAMIADSVLQSATNKYNQGTASAANVDLAKINLEQTKQTQITARYQAITSRNNLKALLGLTIRDSLGIVANLQESLTSDAGGTFAEDPAIRVAYWKTKINKSQLRLSNSAFLPNINILYNYATQRYDKKFEPIDGATGVSGWFPSQYWGLQASFPLFTGGSRWFQSKRNGITYKESLDQYENAQTVAAINDDNIRLNYQKAKAVVEKSDDVMQLSLDNYRHVTNKYNEGMVPIDDRLNAFKDYITYQNQYLNTLSDLMIQVYQVKIRQQKFE